MTGKRNIHVRCRIDFFNFFETKYCPFAIVILLFEDLPSLFGCFFFCPETAVEGIEPLWMKLENSICKLIHGVKCYVLSLEHIIDWHLDVATIVLYLFFKSQLLQLVRQTSLRSRRLEVGHKKKRSSGARCAPPTPLFAYPVRLTLRVSLARARSLFRPLLPT